jgi:RNA-directed DNA polymerase
VNIGEMQRKLSQWATQDKELRFFDLYHLLYDVDWLRLAHDHVARNAGSATAGCDGITMAAWDENLESNQAQLAQELKAETFEPYPVRRVYIPKAHGKTRPLGIPSIKDRIVQEALRMILEPIFEADFSHYSFGFRPTRRTMDAVRYLQWSINERKRFFWVIEGDISSYFDTIHHPKLLRLVARRLKDKKILRLIWKFLRAGVMEKKTFQDTKLGTPQGGIISPLLANIYLQELDRYMAQHTALTEGQKHARRKAGKGNFTYVRYADDFVILGNGRKAEIVAKREDLHQFLSKTLRLNLSMEKTRITHVNDGFKFLGFWIQRCRGSQGMTTKILIPKEAMEKMRARLALTLAPGTTNHSLNAKILALSRIIGGWCRYYQYTSQASTQFNNLEHDLFWPMAHWIGRKYRLGIPMVLQRYQRDGAFCNGERRLSMPTDFLSLAYRQRFFKPNPYLTREPPLDREELPSDTYWHGYEPRPGMADLRPMIMERDGYVCQLCGEEITPSTGQVDHVRPVRRFKRAIDANVEWNLWTLCMPCHRRKTETDRQTESRVR